MEPLSNNFTLTEKSSTSILLKFWGYFWLQDFRGFKKAPFMYVEICPWVILFNSKLENEVLDDFQTYRLEKHGFFRFQGSPTRYGEFWGLQFGLQSPQNFIFINFRKNWKCFNFIMCAQNAPVFTCNPKFWNGIRFLTMRSLNFRRLPQYEVPGMETVVTPSVQSQGASSETDSWQTVGWGSE